MMMGAGKANRMRSTLSQTVLNSTRPKNGSVTMRLKWSKLFQGLPSQPLCRLKSLNARLRP